jgi:signal transduction histidine kinase
MSEPEPAGEPVGDPAGAAMEIIATVSHELRSPLTSIKGYTSLILNRWDRLGDDQKRMMLEQIQHDADRVTRLITELLDISRLEAGRLTLRRERVDLRDVIARVVEQVGMAYPDLRAEIALPDDLPPVFADPDKVEQVLTNLVENAAKYADPARVRITATHDAAAVTVAVEDHGEGISAEDLPRLFDRFFRRDHGRPTGTGLGLWISRRLAEAHGGSLTATSDGGAGSVFRLELPLGDPSNGDQ